MERNAQEVSKRCSELVSFWGPRDPKMKQWYQLIQMVDTLQTKDMESFVGHEPRALYNLMLHLLDSTIPHRVESRKVDDPNKQDALEQASEMLEAAWLDVGERFRRSGPRQSFNRTAIGLMLATGWYSVFAALSDDGETMLADIWNPAEVFPMWGHSGLMEVAHVFTLSQAEAYAAAGRLGSSLPNRAFAHDIKIEDYWWVDGMDIFGQWVVWNAIVMDSHLVKYEPTRFTRIPVYIGPVGGLPDMGALSSGRSSNWKAEIGQSVIATNENIYKTWNKWWTFSMQLLRDTAQPRVFERSRSGKAIVKPEDIFRRGAIFRGGPEDSVDFLVPPPMPLELRTTQLDLEAMMQRGGVSWALMGSVSGQVTAYVMSQISASANQVARPFHDAIQNLFSDIDTDVIQDWKVRAVKPYGYKFPTNFPKDARANASYEIEIPGDVVQRATTARMLDPDFRLSYSYVLSRLFPDIKNPLKERARIWSDKASMAPENGLIAAIQFYRMQSAYFNYLNDTEVAALYDMAIEHAKAQLGGGAEQQIADAMLEQGQGQQRPRLPVRPEVRPPPSQNTGAPTI